METALDIARNDSACPLHQEDERPYRVNALYAACISCEQWEK